MESYENNFNSQQLACSHNVQSTTYPLPDQNTNDYTANKKNVNTTESFTFNENSKRSFSTLNESTSKSDDQTSYQPYYKASGLPKELISMFGALHCMLCDVQVESTLTAKTHYQGKAHIKKVKAHLITWCKNTGNPMPDLPKIHRSKTNLEKDKCSLCDVTFTSAADAEIHFSGKNHMKRLQNPDRPLKRRKNVHLPEDPTGRFGIGLSFFSEQVPILEDQKPENKVKPKYYCDMCSVQAIDENQLKQHLNGARHFKALKAKTSTVVPAPANPADSILASVCRADENLKVVCDYSMHRTPTGYYYCQVCNLTMNSEEQFTQHVESKKHKAKNPPKKSQDGTLNTYCQLCSSKNLKSTTIL